MNIRRTIGLLPAVFVIVGLAFMPMVAPAAAKSVAATEMIDMSAMIGDMSCCEDGHSTDGCVDCPFIAVCLLTVALAEPASAGAVRVVFEARQLSFTFHVLVADGFIGVPPYHPPRI